MGSFAKELIHVHLYKTPNEVYKARLKAFHKFGKGISSELKSHHTAIQQDIKKVGSDIQMHFPKIFIVNRENKLNKKKISTIKSYFITL